MVATIVANLLGDRTLLSSLALALCNAGEALLTAWPDRAPLRSGLSASAGCATCSDCWRRHRRDRGLGDWRDRGIQVVPQPDGTDPDHLAALVRIRRTRHRHGCTAVDRARLSLREPPPRSELDRRHCGARGAGRDDRPYHFPAAGALGDRGACRPAVPAAAVACGPLPAGLRRGGRIHRCRSQSSGRQPSASVISATPVFRSTTASWAPKPSILAVSLCAFVLAALFAERRQHEAVLWRAKRGCRRR